MRHRASLLSMRGRRRRKPAALPCSAHQHSPACVYPHSQARSRDAAGFGRWAPPALHCSGTGFRSGMNSALSAASRVLMCCRSDSGFGLRCLHGGQQVVEARTEVVERRRGRGGQSLEFGVRQQHTGICSTRATSSASNWYIVLFATAPKSVGGVSRGSDECATYTTL
jgi:hypothetical protein